MGLVVAAASLALAMTPVLAADLDADQTAAAASLIANAGGLEPGETPRVRVDERGVVTHFAAPRGRTMTVDGAVPGDGKDKTALKFIETHAQALGVVSDSVELNVHAISTTPERSYVRVRQLYNGIPVHGAAIVVQVEADGTVKSFVSDIMTDTANLDADPAATQPALDSAAASGHVLEIAGRLLQRAQEDYRADIAFAVESGEIDAAAAEELLERANAAVAEINGEGELLIYAPHVIGEEGESTLTWAFKVRDTAGIMSPVQVLVNADTGKLAHANPLVAHAIDRRVYDNHLLGSWGLPYATLRRTETSGPVTIFDTIHFLDFNAHFDILGYTYDYFDQRHGWDGMDGTGGPIRSYMRYNLDFNAGTDVDEGYMVFGIYGLAVSDDVVGHEYTHGVVYNISGLNYWRQAGAISESLADMWGEFIDWSCPVLGNDLASQKWQVGETTLPGPIRDMQNPPAFSHPDRYQGTYWYYWPDGMTEEEEVIANSIFVHTNSGVGNKLVYLLTAGDTFNGKTVSGMGQAVVRNLYWETVQLMPVSPNYHDLHDLLLDAAGNLGMTSTQIANIQTACEAVEIN
jgi:Zn-dependent metalloprotease